MQEMKLSALVAGLLSCSFYVIYTALQLPVGVLFDRKNARNLLTSSAFICSIGCLVFASGEGLFMLFLGRILIGFGSAFAFVGLSHLLRQYFPAKLFGFMIGLSETLGFFVTAIGIFGMSGIIFYWGWRNLIYGAMVFGFFIATLCYLFLPSTHESKNVIQEQRPFYKIFTNHQVWCNALFVGFSFSVVTVFGALWAVPFMAAKLGCSIQVASRVCAVYFIGTGISCPLFGILANYVINRKKLIISACLITALFLLILLYLPTQSYSLSMFLIFMIGVSCGAYILSYSISNELAPPSMQSTLTGFTNTLAVLSALILQPAVGYLLDYFNHTGLYIVEDYQKALLVIPCSLLIACFLVLFLPEKKESSVNIKQEIYTKTCEL